MGEHVLTEPERLAREAGASGASYADFAASDGYAEAVEAAENGGARVDFRRVEAAYREGRREWRLAGGWVSIWTTAEADYDGFGTETAEECGEYNGRPLRRVIVDPHYVTWQTGRYGSGGRGSWDEDPREQERRWAAELAREKAEKEDREQRRAAGLQWIQAADAALLGRLAEEDGEELRLRALAWTDARDELRRREQERVASERAATWAKCRAAFVDGVTLVDDGAPSRPNPKFPEYKIPGRDPRVWHGVKVRPHYACADDAEEALVLDDSNDSVGSLADVAHRLEKGELRIARPDEHVPPRPVIKRIGCAWNKILRVELGVAVAWVGRPLFSWDPIVVDDSGHLVRKKALREAGEQAIRARTYGGSAS